MMDDEDFLTLTGDMADAAVRGGMEPVTVDAYTEKARQLVQTAHAFDTLYEPPTDSPSNHGYDDDQ